MILLSRSWGVSFFSPSFKGPPEELALVNFASADDVLLKQINVHNYCTNTSILIVIVRGLEHPYLLDKDSNVHN